MSIRTPPTPSGPTGVLATLAPAGANIPAGDHASAEAHETGYSKNNPFPAPVVENRNLNGPGEKQTHQIALSLDGSDLDYEVGDALGVYPLNPPDVVDEIIANLPFKAGDVPAPDGGEIPLRDALIRHYDIGSLNKSIIQKWQAKSGSPFLRSLVAADDKKAYDDFCWGRDLIDLVIDHPADFADAEEFVSILKKLQPRLYSIASSPRAHPGEVHLCVGIVRYHTFGRKRGGICSTFLADRVGRRREAARFRPLQQRVPPSGQTATPTSSWSAPAPASRRSAPSWKSARRPRPRGRNWLFFGNPHRATDFLYQEEIEAYLADGTLAKFDVAWSRDQKEKLYVQHLMLQQGAELWSWLSNGAAFYVCGDASRMAKDVDQALLKIAEEHGKLSTGGGRGVHLPAQEGEALPAGRLLRRRDSRHGSGNAPLMIAECPDNRWCALDAEADPVAGVPHPADVEVASLAAGHHGESRPAFLVRALKLDPLQQRDHLRILKSGVDVLPDALEEKRKILGLRPDGRPPQGSELAVELLQDFLGTRLHSPVVIAAPAALENHHQSPCDRPCDQDGDVEESGKRLQRFHQEMNMTRPGTDGKLEIGGFRPRSAAGTIPSDPARRIPSSLRKVRETFYATGGAFRKRSR